MNLTALRTLTPEKLAQMTGTLRIGTNPQRLALLDTETDLLIAALQAAFAYKRELDNTKTI
jgi:hypothetical protein